MCRRTLDIFLHVAKLKTGSIRVIIDGSREEAAKADVVEGEDADFHLTAIKRRLRWAFRGGRFSLTTPTSSALVNILVIWTVLNSQFGFICLGTRTSSFAPTTSSSCVINLS